MSASLMVHSVLGIIIIRRFGFLLTPPGVLLLLLLLFLLLLLLLKGGEHDNSFDHEAILGSKKEAEEFDDLTPEEAKRRLKVIYCLGSTLGLNSDFLDVDIVELTFSFQVLLGKMDRNLDHQVDRKELYAWILRSFK